MSERSRVHVYARVSSQAQEDNTSLGTQEAACRAWAAERTLPVASVAHDVWSGGDRHRPALDDLLDRLVPGDVLLSYDLDRLSRGGQVDTAVIIDRIESAGASVAFVTLDFEQSETGALIRNVRAFAAALEREKIAERTQRGRRARVASGKPLVGRKAPYGYRWADDEKTRLDLDPDTAPVVRRLFDWALAGVSLRETVKRLADLGIPSPTGKPRWSFSPVRDILRRTVYTGAASAYALRSERRPQGGYARRPGTTDEIVLLPNIATPIVTPEEQAAVVARLAVNKDQAARNNRNPEAALLRAGFLTCGHCGAPLRVVHRPATLPGSSPQYRCENRQAPCPRPTITASLIDGTVWEKAASILRDPSVVATEVAKRRQDGGLDRDLAAIDKQIASIADKQGRITKRLAEIDDDDVAALFMAELHALVARKTAADGERDDLMRRIADRADEDARVRSLAEWCSRVGANLDTLRYDEKRLALNALGVKVRVYKPGSMDADGTPLQRWDMTMRPAFAAEHVVYGSTRRCAMPSSPRPASQRSSISSP
jgi:site-specific DNA recombinase